MIALLLLGFLVGVRHALEADHLAAVASLASRAASPRETIKVATAWGCGHAASLVLVGAALIALGVTLPEIAARGFELLAACVLIALGMDVLRRARKQRIHFHVHEHKDGARHLHLHRHGGGHSNERSEHAHEHTHGMLPRALAMGGLHGLAGTGALVVVSMQLLGSGWEAFAYVLTFALGSILGMVSFSLALSLPLVWSPRIALAAAGKLEATLGVATIALGCWMAIRAASF